jgi:hypothetical protein
MVNTTGLAVSPIYPTGKALQLIQMPRSAPRVETATNVLRQKQAVKACDPCDPVTPPSDVFRIGHDEMLTHALSHRRVTTNWRQHARVFNYVAMIREHCGIEGCVKFAQFRGHRQPRT